MQLINVLVFLQDYVKKKHICFSTGTLSRTLNVFFLRKTQLKTQSFINYNLLYEPLNPSFLLRLMVEMKWVCLLCGFLLHMRTMTATNKTLYFAGKTVCPQSDHPQPTHSSDNFLISYKPHRKVLQYIRIHLCIWYKARSLLFVKRRLLQKENHLHTC